MAKGGSTQSAGTSTVNQQVNLPPEISQLLGLLPEPTQGALALTPATPYQGATVAPPARQTTEALGLGESLARSLGDPGATVRNLGQATAAGDYLNPASNPYLASTIDYAQRPIREAFTSDVLPNIGAKGYTEGAYGSPQMQNLQLRAARDFERALGDVSSNIAGQNYARERELQLASPSLISQGLGLSTAPIEMLRGVGGGYESIAQNAIQNDLNAYNAALTAPWFPLQQVAGLAGSLPAPTSSTTTTSGTVPTPGVASNFLSGALGGAALGASAAGPLSIGLPWAAGGGALLGALAGALG